MAMATADGGEEQLSRKVLESLRALNASLGDVRRRLASIDALSRVDGGGAAGAATAGGRRRPAAASSPCRSVASHTASVKSASGGSSRTHTPPPAAFTHSRGSAGSSVGANEAWRRAAEAPDADALSAGSRHSSRHSRGHSVHFTAAGGEEEEEEEAGGGERNDSGDDGASSGRRSAARRRHGGDGGQLRFDSATVSSGGFDDDDDDDEFDDGDGEAPARARRGASSSPPAGRAPRGSALRAGGAPASQPAVTAARSAASAAASAAPSSSPSSPAGGGGREAVGAPRGSGGEREQALLSSASKRRSAGSVRFASAQLDDAPERAPPLGSGAAAGDAAEHRRDDGGSSISSDAPGAMDDMMRGLDDDLAELMQQQHRQLLRVGVEPPPTPGGGDDAGGRGALAPRALLASPLSPTTVQQQGGTPRPRHVGDTALARWEAFQQSQPPPEGGAGRPLRPPQQQERLVFRFRRYDPRDGLEDDGLGEDIPLAVTFVSDEAFRALQDEAATAAAISPEPRRPQAASDGRGGEREEAEEGGRGYTLTGALAADPVCDDVDGIAARIAAWRGGDIAWHDAAPEDAAAAASPAAQQQPRFEALSLRVVYQAGRTGFAESKDLEPAPGSTIAGRYLVREFLGAAAFSTAMACTDLATGEDVCLKIVKNKKEFVDQSLDEIKLLRYLNAAGGGGDAVLRLLDYFYFQEHLIIVTELLKDNLFEFQRYLALHRQPPYFTPPRLQSIARQVLACLAHIHELGIIHSDLKPENLLIKSYSRCEVRERARLRGAVPSALPRRCAWGTAQRSAWPLPKVP